MNDIWKTSLRRWFSEEDIFAKYVGDGKTKDDRAKIQAEKTAEDYLKLINFDKLVNNWVPVINLLWQFTKQRNLKWQAAASAVKLFPNTTQDTIEREEQYKHWD